jgi:hypothetical protein
MCLTVNREKTKRHSSITTNKKHRFYKIFKIHENELRTYFQNKIIETDSQIIDCNAFFIDIKKALPSIFEPKQFFDDIKKAFDIIEMNTKISLSNGVLHAYTNLYNLNNAIRFNDSKSIIIPIIVESNDIIAFGINGDVCMLKYKISKHSWKLIKQKMKEINHMPYNLILNEQSNTVQSTKE